jgi:hypothetical protein
MRLVERSIEDWCKYFNLIDYTICSESGVVDVNTHVGISVNKLYKIPIQFGVINGVFYCNENNLKSLKGCPKKVNDGFSCNRNFLRSLKYAPKIVLGEYYCGGNNISSLKGVPLIINGYFECSYNKLKTLKNGPKEVIGDFNCNNNKLTTLNGGPLIVHGGYYCKNNDITSLEGIPLNLKKVDCSNNPADKGAKDFGLYKQYVRSVKLKELLSHN